MLPVACLFLRACFCVPVPACLFLRASLLILPHPKQDVAAGLSMGTLPTESDFMMPPPASFRYSWAVEEELLQDLEQVRAPASFSDSMAQPFHHT